MYDMYPSQLYSDLLNKLNGLLIRSLCEWIKEVDKQTKYFTALKRNKLYI